MLCRWKKWKTPFSQLLGLISINMPGFVTESSTNFSLSAKPKASFWHAVCLSVYGHALTVINGDKWSTKPRSQMIMKCSLSSNLNPSKNSGFNLQQYNISLAQPFDKCMHTKNTSSCFVVILSPSYSKYTLWLNSLCIFKY